MIGQSSGAETGRFGVKGRGNETPRILMNEEEAMNYKKN
jgi:hypothetical protein